MESDRLKENPETLFGIAREIAAVVTEHERKTGIRQNTQTLLRATLAATAFVRTTDLAMLAEESLRVRLRLTQLIGEISLTLSNDELSKLAGYVLLISA